MSSSVLDQLRDARTGKAQEKRKQLRDLIHRMADGMATPADVSRLDDLAAECGVSLTKTADAVERIGRMEQLRAVETRWQQLEGRRIKAVNALLAHDAETDRLVAKAVTDDDARRPVPMLHRKWDDWAALGKDIRQSRAGRRFDLARAASDAGGAEWDQVRRDFDELHRLRLWLPNFLRQIGVAETEHVTRLAGDSRK